LFDSRRALYQGQKQYTQAAEKKQQQNRKTGALERHKNTTHSSPKKQGSKSTQHIMQSTGFHTHSYNKHDPLAVLCRNQPHACRCTKSTTSDLSTTPLLNTQLFLVFQIAQIKASQTIEKHFLRCLFDPHPTNTAYDIGR
jgi:hypothetical protein